MNDTKDRADAEIKVDPRADLAVERTELALERTHLAWIRTTFTIITAGIAIDKGIAYIHEKRIAEGVGWVRNAHFIGLTLSIAGTILLLVESYQYVRRCMQLSIMRSRSFSILSPAIIIAALVILMGTSVTLLISWDH